MKLHLSEPLSCGCETYEDTNGKNGGDFPGDIVISLCKKHGFFISRTAGIDAPEDIVQANKLMDEYIGIFGTDPHKDGTI